MGSHAQTLVSTSNRARKGLIQPGIRLRQGEALEITLWARAIHDPVTLTLGV